MTKQPHAKPRPITLPLALAGDHAWVYALRRFDQGNRKLLATLIAKFLSNPAAIAHVTGDPPEIACDAVAAIIAGTRAPDARGLKKRDLPSGQRRMAVEAVRHLREKRDDLKAALPKGWTRARVAVEYARGLQAIADECGVRLETLEGWAKPSAGMK